MPRRRRMPSTNPHYSLGNTTGTLRLSPVQTKLLQDSAQDTQDCHVSSTTTSLMQEIQSFPIVTNLQLQQNDPELDADKKTIVNHPLYPLLAALLQQCELASARPDSPPPLDAFTEELRTYVQRQFEMEDADLIKSKLKDKDYYTSTFTDQHPYNNTISSGVTGGRLTRAGSRYKQNGPAGDLLGGTKNMRPHSRECRGDKTKESTDKSNSLMDVDYPHDPMGPGLDSGPFEEDRKLNVFVNDRELDELIVKAIQVLRIHLLELHKVNELCKDFCSRYIHSLKTKFQSDPMIQGEQNMLRFFRKSA
ncbi:homeobox protein PKNOX1, partial [Clonorchis sinensis]